MSYFFGFQLLFRLFLSDVFLVFAQSADSFLVEFLFLRIGVVSRWISENIQIFDFHVDVNFRWFLIVHKANWVALELI